MIFSRKSFRKSVKIVSNLHEVFHYRRYSSTSEIQSSSLFNSSTTAHEVVKTLNYDVSGKVGLVTGSNTGIGKETAKALLEAGFGHIILTGRDVKKTKAVKEELIMKFPNVSIHDLGLDLADSKSIESFAKKFEDLRLPLHLLINNAGVFATPRMETKDGYEFQNGVNHLGTFRLTLLLLPLMARTKGEKRIITVSSDAHKIAPKRFNIEDFHMRSRKYSNILSYGQSKFCNILFTNELDHRLSKIYKKENPDHFICCSVNPGFTKTEITRDAPNYMKLIMTLSNLFWGENVEQGAATTVFAALAKDLKGGEYLEKCKVSVCHSLARDEVLMNELFEWSLKETKMMTFPVLKQNN